MHITTVNSTEEPSFHSDMRCQRMSVDSCHATAPGELRQQDPMSSYKAGVTGQGTSDVHVMAKGIKRDQDGSKMSSNHQLSPGSTSAEQGGSDDPAPPRNCGLAMVSSKALAM